MSFQRTGLRALMVATATMLCLGGSAATAQDRDGDEDRQRENRWVRFLDTDGDGRVSLDEIKAEQQRLISAADVDDDGMLSVEEFRRRGRLFMRLRATTLFDLMDANGDEMLTAEEIAAPSERWLARYDANGDGGLDADEVLSRRGRRGHRR